MWWYAALVLAFPAVLVWLGYATSLGAWAVALLGMGYMARQALRMRRAEQQFWNARKDLVAMFADGRLLTTCHGEPQAFDLAVYAAVDAVMERGRVVRLLADQAAGNRDIYAGYDDMQSFAAEFKRHARTARFRYVRLGFPMTLKEI